MGSVLCCQVYSFSAGGCLGVVAPAPGGLGCYDSGYQEMPAGATTLGVRSLLNTQLSSWMPCQGFNFSALLMNVFA